MVPGPGSNSPACVVLKRTGLLPIFCTIVPTGTITGSSVKLVNFTGPLAYRSGYSVLPLAGIWSRPSMMTVTGREGITPEILIFSISGDAVIDKSTSWLMVCGETIISALGINNAAIDNRANTPRVNNPSRTAGKCRKDGELGFISSRIDLKSWGVSAEVGREKSLDRLVLLRRSSLQWDF